MNKVGIVTGAFDLLHAGHIHFLQECRKRCLTLIVALNVDPSKERKKKNKPIETLVERQIKLLGCMFVSETWVYETEEELALLLKYLQPDIRFLGSDSKDRTITAEDVIPIEYIESLPIHTSDIRERILNDNH